MYFCDFGSPKEDDLYSKVKGMQNNMQARHRVRGKANGKKKKKRKHRTARSDLPRSAKSGTKVIDISGANHWQMQYPFVLPPLFHHPCAGR